MISAYPISPQTHIVEALSDLVRTRELAPCERYAIDYDFCKGCGICAAECPCGAIEMVPEQI